MISPKENVNSIENLRVANTRSALRAPMLKDMIGNAETIALVKNRRKIKLMKLMMPKVETASSPKGIKLVLINSSPAEKEISEIKVGNP